MKAAFNKILHRPLAPSGPSDQDFAGRNAAFMSTVTARISQWHDAALNAGMAPQRSVLQQLNDMGAALSRDPKKRLGIPPGLPLHAVNLIVRTAQELQVGVVRLEPKDVAPDTSDFSKLSTQNQELELRSTLLTLEFPKNLVIDAGGLDQALSEDPVVGTWRDLAAKICTAPNVDSQTKIRLLTTLRTRLEGKIAETSRDGKSPVGFQIFCELAGLVSQSDRTVAVPPEVSNANAAICGAHGYDIQIRLGLGSYADGPCTPEGYSFAEAGRAPVDAPEVEHKSPPPVVRSEQAIEHAFPPPGAAPDAIENVAIPVPAPRSLDDIEYSISTLSGPVEQLPGKVRELRREIDALPHDAVRISNLADLATAARDVFELHRVGAGVSWSSARLAVFEPFLLSVAGSTNPRLKAIASQIDHFAKTVNDEPMGVVSINDPGHEHRFVWD